MVSKDCGHKHKLESNLAKKILALDIGTSSVRAGIYSCSDNPKPLKTVRNERRVDVTRDGGFEIDSQIALQQAIAAIDDVLDDEDCEIEEIAISCFWHSLMGIDIKGNPTTNLFAWGETRPARFVEILRNSLDESEYHNRTGCRFHSSYWVAKLMWLREDFPRAFDVTQYWISFSDFLFLRVLESSSVPKTGVSMASGTGLFNLRTNSWDKEILDFLGLDESNFPVFESAGTTTKLNSKFAKRWKNLANGKWHQAIGDGAANNLGAGCYTKNRVAIMIGTSGAMRIAYEGRPPKVLPEGLWCYRIDSKRILIGGAISDGGGLYSWLRENFRLDVDDNKTEYEIANRGAFEHGITFLPFLAGERSTGYNDFAQGSIVGLHLSHDYIDIVQAAFEAVAFRFAAILDQLSQVTKIDEIVASGGALRESPVWTQIIADVLGRDITLPNSREASSIGAALLAAINSDETLNFPKQVELQGKRITFRADRFETYQQARKTHENYYKMIVNPPK